MDMHGEGIMARKPHRFGWPAVAIIAGVLSLFKGARLPNRWSATQALVDYSQGFTKRGLFGAIVANPFHLWFYDRFAVVSVVLFIVLLAALVLFTLRSGITGCLGGNQITAMFFGSYTLPLLANAIGYLDIPLASITLLLLLVAHPQIRFTLAIPLLTVALLVHELYLIVFVPVLFLSFLLQALGEENTRKARQAIWMGSILVVFALLIAAGLALKPSMDAGRAAKMQTTLAAKADFPMYSGFSDVLTRSARDNVEIMRGELSNDVGWQTGQIGLFIVLAPPIVLTLWTTIATIKSSQLRHKEVAIAVACCASLSALLMNCYGFDFTRWDGLTGLNAFVVLLTAYRFARRSKPVQLGFSTEIIVATLCLSMASGGFLMDSATRFYPPTHRIKQILFRLHENRSERAR